MILLAQRQPKPAFETACGRQASHNPTVRRAAKPTVASPEISTPNRRFGYFRRRSFCATYTIPIPLASRARLDGSGTATVPAKAVVVAAQIVRSETRETGTR